MRRRESIVLGLLDPTFKRLVTPRLAGCLYAVVFGLAFSGTFFCVTFIWGLTTWAGEGWWYLVPPILLGGLAFLLATRVVLEVAVALVRGASPARSVPAPPAPPAPPAAPAAVAGEGWRVDPAEQTIRTDMGRWLR